MTKHARFLQIEPRPEAPSPGDPAAPGPDAPPPSESADRARIAAVLASAPRAADPAPMELAVEPPARGGRSRPERAPPPVSGPSPAEQRSLEAASPALRMLDEAPEGRPAEMALDVALPEAQPFVRCARCGADSAIHAAVCANCGERLDTAEQRAHNDRVWEAQRREKERERAALEGMAAARYQSAKQAARPLPGAEIAPPPELLEPLDESGPALFATLRLLRKPLWRWVAGALVTALPLLLVTLGGPILSRIGWILLVLLVLSLLPRRAARWLVQVWAASQRR